MDAKVQRDRKGRRGEEERGEGFEEHGDGQFVLWKVRAAAAEEKKKSQNHCGDLLLYLCHVPRSLLLPSNPSNPGHEEFSISLPPHANHTAPDYSTLMLLAVVSPSNFLWGNHPCPAKLIILDSLGLTEEFYPLILS